MKLGVFVPNWIGDAVMCTPTLRALRRHYGASATMVGVLRPYVDEVLAGTTWLDERVYYHPHSNDSALRWRAVAASLRARKLDAIVLMTNSLRSAAMAWHVGAPVRAGYVRYGRGWMLTHRLYPPMLGRRRLPTPAIDYYLQLAYAVGCELESPRLELATVPADEAAADGAWRRLRLPAGDSVVVLNSGGAYGSAKTWPVEYFAELAVRLACERQLAVLVNCGPAEREAAREIVRQAAHSRVVSLAEEPLSIGLSKACIRRGRLLISTDSGPRFFGVAFGVPVISLYGPTDPRWSHTHDPGEVCLHHEVACGPCARRVCPLGHHQCMRLLSVERVYREAARLLDSRPKRQVA